MAHRIPMAIAMPRAPPRAPVPPWLQQCRKRHPRAKQCPSPTVRPAGRLRRPQTSPQTVRPAVRLLRPSPKTAQSRPWLPKTAQSRPWLQQPRAKARPSPTLRPAVRLLRPLAIATKTAAAAVQSPLQQRRHPRAQPFEATSGPKAEHLAAAPDAEDLAFKHEFVEGEASAEERPASAASSTPSAPAEWEADVR